MGAEARLGAGARRRVGAAAAPPVDTTTDFSVILFLGISWLTFWLRESFYSFYLRHGANGIETFYLLDYAVRAP
jgi:hypothetical protein